MVFSNRKLFGLLACAALCQNKPVDIFNNH